MRYIIGDTETTGLGPTRKAIEVALIEIDEDLNILGEAEALLHPGSEPISEEASAVHGITLAELEGKPTIEQWLADTWGAPIEGEVCLIGYRIVFDRPMLQPLFAEEVQRLLDVLPYVQRYFPGLPNHKLQTVREHLGLDGNAHRAMGDVLTTYQLLRHILQMTGRPLAAHATTPLAIVHRMPWGAHKGKLLAEVPRKYREWMLAECDLEPNLRLSLELLRKTEINLK